MHSLASYTTLDGLIAFSDGEPEEPGQLSGTRCNAAVVNCIIQSDSSVIDSIFVTDRDIFKGKFPVKVTSTLLTVSFNSNEIKGAYAQWSMAVLN